MPIVKIDQDDIAHALAPIWYEKPVTAKKAISRLRTVFKYARAKGFLVNRAVIEEAVIILRENRKLAKPSLALPWSDVPAFYASLSDGDPTQLALRLLILTGVRADSVNNMMQSVRPNASKMEKIAYASLAILGMATQLNLVNRLVIYTVASPILT
ncbi:hypothetical protein RA2_04555 [Roseovarius sp. A-2]|nr:hypothetical protein RA2_04555 [Roseovarius sp. A-2]